MFRSQQWWKKPPFPGLVCAPEVVKSVTYFRWYGAHQSRTSSLDIRSGYCTAVYASRPAQQQQFSKDATLRHAEPKCEHTMHCFDAALNLDKRQGRRRLQHHRDYSQLMLLRWLQPPTDLSPLTQKPVGVSAVILR